MSAFDRSLSTEFSNAVDSYLVSTANPRPGDFAKYIREEKPSFQPFLDEFCRAWVLSQVGNSVVGTQPVFLTKLGFGTKSSPAQSVQPTATFVDPNSIKDYGMVKLRVMQMLTHNDCEMIIGLLGNEMYESDKEKIRSARHFPGSDLMEWMERRGHIKDPNLSYLAEKLRIIGRNPVADIVEAYMNK